MRVFFFSLGVFIKLENKDGKCTDKDLKTSIADTHNNNSDLLPDGIKKEFKLAPTPAQLGKAPLQRRQSMGRSLKLFKKKYMSISFIVFSVVSVE
jgi:hypothetical protein